MQPIDWIIVAVYFVAVFGIAFWVTRPKSHTRDTSAGYFLAGRNAGWFVIGASLFASNIGSEHLVGLAGTGFTSGVALGQYEVQASLVLLLLGWLFVPFYLRSTVYTMPEFLERRYSPAARWYLAVISIIGYVLTKISVTLFAGGIVFESLVGIDFWQGAIILVLATGVYTILGGLRAVLYTDMLQAFVLIFGALAILVIGLNRIGGWGEMAELAGSAHMSMWKPMSDPDFPWTGIVFGAPIVAVWYWCTDQFIVQRVLSAPNVHQARLGTIFAAYLKQSALFLFVIPGVIAFGLVEKGLLQVSDSFDANTTYPLLILELLPKGLSGLVFAGLLAALMSSLSSVFNSCSTLVTMDIYKKVHPESSERRLVIVGQLATVVMIVLGLAWIPFMKYISQDLYGYLQSVQAYISPPIAAVFLLGIFWKRVNGHGAIVSLVAGFVLGMGRLALQLNDEAIKANFGESSLVYQYTFMNFMHVAIFLFLVCVALLIGVSLLTRPESDEQLDGLTFQTTDRLKETALQAGSAGQRGLQILLSLGVVAVVVVVWLIFRG